MTRTTARILAFICALGTMLLVFQARLITPGEGEHVFIYSVPGNRNPGSDVLQELEQQLTQRHGEMEQTVQIGTVLYKGEEAPLLERVDHEIEVMGDTFSGDRYLSCTVRTTRNAVRGEKKILAAADHTVTYIALDPAGEDRAEILWDTMEEATSGKWDILQLPEES